MRKCLLQREDGKRIQELACTDESPNGLLQVLFARDRVHREPRRFAIDGKNLQLWRVGRLANMNVGSAAELGRTMNWEPEFDVM
jgi:hypothetical protein